MIVNGIFFDFTAMVFLMGNSGGYMLALPLTAILRGMRIGSMSVRGYGFAVSL